MSANESYFKPAISEPNTHDAPPKPVSRATDHSAIGYDASPINGEEMMNTQRPKALHMALSLLTKSQTRFLLIANAALLIATLALIMVMLLVQP